jgi:hypothetical protein
VAGDAADRKVAFGLSAARHVTSYDLGHFAIVSTVPFAETFRDTVPILHLTILAHLPLAFESRDGKAETYDAAQHNFYVNPGCIRRCPWLGFVPLLLGGKLGYMLVQPVPLVHHFGTTKQKAYRASEHASGAHPRRENDQAGT